MLERNEWTMKSITRVGEETILERVLELRNLSNNLNGMPAVRRD